MKKPSSGNYYPAIKQVRRFVPGAKLSALLLLLTSGAVALIYGTSPFVQVSNGTRRLILLIWLWNVLVFAVCGGMILWAWLVDRYGDR
jgi:ATP/ADP translocase